MADLVVGVNDLGTVDPKLAKEWHPTKNGDWSPKQVTQWSTLKVWWVCSECRHEWLTTISSRSMGTGCPACNNIEKARRNVANAIKKNGSLGDICLDLVTEWHPVNNGDLTPFDVSIGSKRKVWWICDKGHEWEASVWNRYKNKTNCPICVGRIVSVGFNDLATVMPNIAAEWHPAKNEDLLPTQVSSGSNKKVWWICEKGHEWEARISNRCRGAKCPVCQRNKRYGSFGSFEDNKNV